MAQDIDHPIRFLHAYKTAEQRRKSAGLALKSIQRFSYSKAGILLRPCAAAVILSAAVFLSYLLNLKDVRFKASELKQPNLPSAAKSAMKSI